MKEVILLGTAPSRKFCDFSCETWGVNGCYTIRDINEKEGKPFRMDKIFITDHMFSPQGTLHFDIHVMHKLKEDYNCQYITLNPIKLGRYRLKSTPFPYEKVSRKFNTNYFSSSICYMVAYALYKNYTKIRLYGIDMASMREYQQQKGGVEYWLGRAHERGCDVFIAEGSVLLVPPTFTPYGHERKIDYGKIDPYNLLGQR